MAQWMKDNTNKVYEIVYWDLFWELHPDLFLRPLSKEENAKYARDGVI